MRINRWTVVVALVCLLGAADEALAWGPATHVGFAASVLERLFLLPIGVAAILTRHGVAYLYGNITADIVFAKRLSRVKQFCHHWSTAFGLLDAADDDRARAFAYGYLSHLAADTVAHGKFVPRQIVVSRCSVNFGHFYWELRADTLERNGSWRLLGQVLGRLHDSSLAHRDLKATNMLVLWDGHGAPEVVLVDLDGLRKTRLLTARERFQGLMRLNVSLLECPAVNRAGRLRMLLGYLRRPGSGRIPYKPYWRALERWSAWKLRKQMQDRRKRQKAVRGPVP